MELTQSYSFKNKGTTRFCFFTDPHIPFMNQKLFGQMIKEAKERKATIAIIGGDLGDLYSASTFSKEKNYPYEIEYNSKQKVLSLLCKVFEVVIVITGNHDDRPVKRAKEACPEFYKYLTKHPLLRLQDGDEWVNGRFVTNPKLALKNLKIPMLSEGEPSWFTYINNTLVAHTQKYSKTHGSIAEQTYDFFMRENPNIDLVLVGHLHRANINYNKYNAVLVEAPCLCMTPDYVKYKPNLMYSQKQVNGYMFFDHDNEGNLIKDSIVMKVFMSPPLNSLNN